METEQAPEAVQPEEAASAEDAGNIRERSMAVLLDEMSGGHGQTPEEEAPAAPPEPAETEAGDAPAEEEAAKKAKNFRGRWDHLDEQERRVVELTTKRGLTLSEACRAVYGEEAPPVAEKGEPEAQATRLDGEIATQEARVQELKERKAQARAGNLEEYDQAADALIEARERLHALRSERQGVREKEAAQALEAREAAWAQLKEDYPEAIVPGTDLYEACQDELNYLREAQSPLLADPQAEYKVARRLARFLGPGRASAAKGEAIEPRRTVRPVPAGGQPVEAPATTVERRIAQARSTGAILDLMREYGTPFEALLKKG